MNSGETTNSTSGAFVVAVNQGAEVSETQIITTPGEANDLLAVITAADFDNPDWNEEAASDGDKIWLILVPIAEPGAIDRPEFTEIIRAMSRRLTGDDGRSANNRNAAMIVDPPITAGPAAYALDISLLIDEALQNRQQESPRAIAVCCHTVLAVGGFDPTFPGIGLADLATRIRRSGRTVLGAPARGLALTELEPQLDVRQQLRSMADWYRRHGEPDDFGRYQEQVVKAVGYGTIPNPLKPRTDRTELVEQIHHDAKRGWPRPRPDETQRGVGQRADWRFLIKARSIKHLLLAGQAAAKDAVEGQTHFLEADGFADRVSINGISGDQTSAPDVVVIGLGADVGAALAFAAPVATVVLELGRDPIGRFRRVRALRSAGFELTAVYLVTPDLTAPKRYVALAKAEAIQWLLLPPPPLPGTRTGLRRTASHLLVRTVSKMVSKLASVPSLSALAGVGTQGLVVANRGSSLLTTAAGLTDEPPQILMTSGHDEGSRAVLVSLPTEWTPGTVTKMSPRPRYNSNADAEAEVIDAVRSQIVSSGSSDAADLLPTIEPAIADGGLRGAKESYAGRWTATDLCNRVVASRTPVLREVLDAIDRFSLATVSKTAPWTAELFDEYIGDLLVQYRETIGWSKTLEAFAVAMADRSNQMLGEPIPLVLRHYDLGPWNVVFSDSQAGGSKDLTIIDWELAPPRRIGQVGLGGADQLYFTKYWLHIAMETRSVDEELEAFEFVAGASQNIAATALTHSLDRLVINRRFVPLLAAHLWLEAALYTKDRRAENGGDPGSPARYVEALARRRVEVLQFWS